MYRTTKHLLAVKCDQTGTLGAEMGIVIRTVKQIVHTILKGYGAKKTTHKNNVELLIYRHSTPMPAFRLQRYE